MRIRAATADDRTAVSALLSVRPEYVHSEWELPSFDLDRDAWVAEEDRRVAGYAAVTAAQRLVHTAEEPRVADALLARALERARERGFDVVRIAAEAESELVRRHAFELESETLVMWRQLNGAVTSDAVAEAEPPAGVGIRTFEPADAQAVHALLDDAYREWDSHYVPLAHEDWLHWMTGDVDFDPTVWWLAERDRELVGCALHWSTGWLKDLAVRPSERGRGLGRALVQHGLAEFARRGVERVGLKVDAANPTGAVQLYERLGFVVDRREAIWALSL